MERLWGGVANAIYRLDADRGRRQLESGVEPAAIMVRCSQIDWAGQDPIAYSGQANTVLQRLMHDRMVHTAQRLMVSR